MNLPQTFVLGWIQFALASAAILFLANLLARRLVQPAERIRAVQFALATALALPCLVLCSPWTLWQIEVAPAVSEVAANDERKEAPLRSTDSDAGAPDADRPGIDRFRTSPIATSEQELAHAPATPLAIEQPAQSSRPSDAALPSQATRAEATFSFDGWIVAAWALLALHGLAAAILAFESIVGALRLRRLVRSADAPPEEVAAIWQSVTSGRGDRVRLLVSSSVETPLTFGVFRPCVLLPRDLASCGEGAVRSCLAHEWSHIENLDLATWRFAWACQFLLWMQPGFWRLRSELRLAQDILADARSTEAGQDAIEYSALLVRFARKRGALSLGGALTFADRPSQLSRRITMLLEPQAALRSRCSYKFSLGSLLVAIVAAAIVSGVRLDAAPTDEPSSAPPAASQAATPPAAKEETKDEVAADELAGIVVDEEGKPLEGVTVDAWHWYPGNETKTDADGRFLLKGLDPKTRAEVLISKEGYSPQHFAQRPLGVENWRITLSDRTYLEGTILGVDGKPVANADIRASFGPVQADGAVITEVTTEGKSGEDGTYRLYLAPGTYDLQVSAGALGVYREQGVLLREHEAKSFPVTLKPGVRFEARVVDSVTGDPVEGFILWQWRPPYLKAKSDAEGKIVFDGLIPGPTEFNCGGGEPVKLPMPGTYYENGPFGRWWSPDATSEWERYAIDDKTTGWQRNFDSLSFSLEPDMLPVSIVVEQGVTVTGRVTDPDGKPVEGATVAPAKTGSGNSITGDTRYSVKTQKDGTYRVVLPASGKATYNLVAHDGDFQQWRNWANGVSSPMQTVPGQKIENLDLQLTRGATVRGKVTLGGKPKAGLDVRASAFDKLENRYYDPTTQTKADGTFELKFIRPGKHYIQTEPFWLSAEDAPSGSVVVELKPGEVLDGIELKAVPEPKEVMPEVAALPFQAKVVDAEGKPVANVEVALGWFGGVKSQSGTMSENVAGDFDRRTDDKGLAAVPASFLGQSRQNSSWLYAVDRKGKRACVTLFDLEAYADLAPPAVPDPVEMKLAPATLTKITVGAEAFGNLTVKPDGIQLMILKEGAMLQSARLAEAGTWDLLLPPGAYQVTAYSYRWAEPVAVDFEIEAGEISHEETIELQPSRLAKMIGKPAPEFQQIKTSGGAAHVTLAELRGKVVLIDFWGNWCGPCIAAMPALIDLYGEYRERGVEVVALHDDSVESVEELDEIVTKLVKDQWNGRKLPFPVLLDGGGSTQIPGSVHSVNGATTAAYGVTSFPTTIVVDRKGHVVGTLDVRDLKAARERLDALLAKPE